MEVPAKAVECVQCRKSSPPGSSHCSSCGSPLGSEHPTIITENETIINENGNNNSGNDGWDNNNDNSQQADNWNNDDNSGNSDGWS